MPRKSRIDAPGALHHIIVRGIERRKLFVDEVLSMAKEQMERKNKLISKGYNLEMIADRVSSVMELEASEIWKSGKSRRRVAARSLLCFWAVREVGISMTELSRRLELSLSGVSQSVTRGEKIAQINCFELLDNKL
jgi:putative transposase